MSILPRRFGLKDAGKLALLCGAAYLGNYLAVPLFAGLDLLFGGIAVMFTVLRRSLVESVVVALVGSLYTIVLWGHPWALVVFVAEAAFVHTLLIRRRGDATLYDALFWFALVPPAAFPLYGWVWGIGPDAMGVALLKGAINGLFYTSAASALHNALILRRRRGSGEHRPRARLARLLAPVLFAFVLVPTLLTVAVQTHVMHRQYLGHISEMLAAADASLDDPRLGDRSPQALVEALRRESMPLGTGRLAFAVVGDAGAPIAQAPDSWLSHASGRESVDPGLTRRYDRAIDSSLAEARSAYYTRPVADLPAGSAAGRRLIVGMPAASHVDRLHDMQLAALAIALLLTAVGAACAWAVARGTGRLFQPLAAQLRRLPRSVRAGDRVDWPDFDIAELATLTEGVRRMEAELAEYIGALSESEARFRAIAGNLPGGVSRRIMLPDGTIRFSYLSPNYEHVFGIDVKRATEDPRAILDVVHPEDRSAYFAALQRSARTLSPLDVEFRIHHPGGGTRWVRALGQPRRCDDGSVVWDGIAIDETERKAAESELEYLARYDSLTGALNREEILRQLSKRLREPSVRSGLAVLYVDLDHVKTINDGLGHDVGDGVIREAAGRIQGAVRGADRVGRYGGDEFVVVASGIADEAVAETVAERILGSLREPVTVSGHRLDLSASMGILLHPDRDDAQECLRRADVALYQAKDRARGTWRFYTEAMDDERRRRTGLLTELRRALDRDDLFLVYQPKVALSSGRVEGVEALVRWRHPEEGVIPPDWFVPLAEESGLIDQLGDRVLRRACRDLAGWLTDSPDYAPTHVSVNVSGRQLGSEALWNSVWGALEESGLAPDRLELEVTESVFYDARADLLERLSAAGISLAIDDYGKGYSSLFVLRDSPAAVVKIDRSFVGRVLTSNPDRAIVASTITLAHALGRRVVAEGVETGEQQAMLRHMACDAAQGFHIARPGGASGILDVCRRRWHGESAG